ncbi:sulfotransferase family 2 domain-containing protein [soil metagenome]
MGKNIQPIIFLHIPKTAGLTFHEILTDQYPERKHKLIYTVAHTKTYTDLPIDKKNKIGVIKGHLLFGLHESMPLNPIYLTLLRDPIMRTISGYEFIKSRTDHPFHKEMINKNFTLVDFLNQKHVPNFDNIQVRFLCGDNSMPFGAINETHLALAKKNLLSENMLFGMTEFFDESILYFKNELGWKMPYYSNVNVTKKSTVNRVAFDEATKNAILNCNQFDLQLYEFAKSIFIEKIKLLGDEFKFEVELFRKENAKRKNKLARRNYFRSYITRFTQG